MWAYCWLLVAAWPWSWNADEEIDTAAITPALINAFDLHEFRFTGGAYHNETFYYRLFKPDVKRHPGKRPLIVWLHGAGSIELHDPRHTGHLKHLLLVINKPEQRDNYPFYVLAMQMKVNHWFAVYGTTGTGRNDEQMTVLMEIVDEVVANYDIDATRVYLTGVSAGGTGCWELALRYPRRFAAVAPLASSFDDYSRVQRLNDLPIWAFHSAKDKKPTPDSVRQMVSKINASGGNAALTEINKPLHDCWIEAFDEHRLLDWLLSHKQGEAGAIAGHPPLQLSEAFQGVLVYALPIGLVYALLIAIQRELRRRNAVTSANIAEGIELSSYSD